MSNKSNNEYKIIFQKIKELKSEDYKILSISREISDTLKELERFAEAKRMSEQKTYFTGT